jgi:hypothetical protein
MKKNGKKLDPRSVRKAVLAVYREKTSHVVPDGENGGWKVIRSNSDLPLKRFSTKNLAIEYAKKRTSNSTQNLIIHGKNGKIQSSIRHGL